MLQNLPASWHTCNLLTFLTGLRLLLMCDLVVVMRNTQAYVNCIDASCARVVWTAFEGLLLQQDRVRCVWAYKRNMLEEEDPSSSMGFSCKESLPKTVSGC